MLTAACASVAVGSTDIEPARCWWTSGEDGFLLAYVDSSSASGCFGLVNANAIVTTDGHPSLEARASNSRDCVICDQPSHAMSLSLVSIRERRNETPGTDPLYARFDPDPGVHKSGPELCNRCLNHPHSSKRGA